MSDNPERVSFPSHLGGPVIVTAEIQFSIYVSKTLDVLGKNQDMVKYRVKMYKKWQDHYNILYENMEYIVAGSKAEGLTSICERDKDCMLVVLSIICADNIKPFVHDRITTVFQTDIHATHAGYTELKLVKLEGPLARRWLRYSILDDERGDKYLSSDLFLTRIAQVILKKNKKYKSMNLFERCGPSLPISDTKGYHHEDNFDNVVIGTNHGYVQNNQ